MPIAIEVDISVIWLTSRVSDCVVRLMAFITTSWFIRSISDNNMKSDYVKTIMILIAGRG